jgi:hypothetical protein
MCRGAPVRRGRFSRSRSVTSPSPRTLARGENDWASSQNVTHRKSQGNKILHLAATVGLTSHTVRACPALFFVLGCDGNRLHRGLLGQSNVYHTNGYIVRVGNDHSEQVLAGSPVTEAPRARKFLMRVKGLCLTLEDVPYRVLLESLSWTQARAGAFLGVSRQTCVARSMA